MFVFLILSTVVLACVINNFKLKDYYVSKVVSRLETTYDELNSTNMKISSIDTPPSSDNGEGNSEQNSGSFNESDNNNGNVSNQDRGQGENGGDHLIASPQDIQFKIDSIGNKNNMTIVVVSEKYIYTNTEKDGALYGSIYSLLSLISEQQQAEGESTWSIGSSEEDSKKGNFTIKKNHDSVLDTDYYDLIGELDNGNLVLIRASADTINDSVAIANRFFAYVGIIVMIIGTILTIIFSGKFTKPIHEMAIVANKMANLDFDAKVKNISKDEIGKLGVSMNELSCKLENTISELKTANNELSKDIENKVQIDEMRKEFLSHVSHELKTPIALIQGYAEGLKENISEDEESKDFYCEVIMDEASKMNKMVKKLLTLNEIEFGNEMVKIERFDVVTLISNLINSSGILIKEKNINIEFDSSKPIDVWADEYMIEEVLSNYISNAIHYVNDNGNIRISFEYIDSNVRVIVYNSGSHIPEDELDKIWVKFYKVDKARTREYGGSGIGLSIVAATMDAHEKKYGVKNIDGGVEFYIELDIKA